MVKDESYSNNTAERQKEREQAVKSKASVKSPRAVNVNRTSNPGRKTLTVKSPGMKVPEATSRNTFTNE